VADERWKPTFGPDLSRIERCSSCGTLWIQEWVSRMGFGGDEDREWPEYVRVTEAEADARFERA